MAKARELGSIELDAPGMGKSVEATDIRNFGAMPTGAVTESTTGSTLLKSLDIKDDEESEDDNPLEDGSSKGKPGSRYILAKLVLLPERLANVLTVGVNGQRGRFPLGKWVISKASMVATAKNCGEMSFRNDPKAAVKQIAQNHPRFMLQEIPEPWNTAEKVREFQAKLQAERGRLIPFACDNI
jgi:hypothetical protein